MRQARYRTAVALDCAGTAGTGSQPRATLEAKGEHYLADEIVRIARECNVPVVEDAALARVLGTFEADEEIPADLAAALAIVLQGLEADAAGHTAGHRAIRRR